LCIKHSQCFYNGFLIYQVFHKTLPLGWLYTQWATLLSLFGE
jgi:hypothetical protein